MPSFKTLFASLMLHALLAAFVVFVLPMIHLNLPIALPNASQEKYISAELIALPEQPQLSQDQVLQDDTLLEPQKPSNLSDKDRDFKRAGNTALKAQTDEEAPLKGAKKQNTQSESAKQKEVQAKVQPTPAQKKTAGLPPSSHFSRFLRQMNDALIQNWTRPENVQSGVELTASFEVELAPSGEILNVSLQKSSGNDLFDRSALVAIQKLKRFSVPDDRAVFEAYFQHLTLNFSNPPQ